MSENVRLKPKQWQLLNNLVLGQSITAACKAIGISDKTAQRWLAQPAIQAELARLEDETRHAQEAEINQIMTTGLAATHKRVEALSELATILRASMNDPETGEIEPRFLAPDKIREYRGALDDIAKEVGGRVKKTESANKLAVEFLTDWGGGSIEDEDEGGD